MNKRQRKKMAKKYGIKRLKPYKAGETLKDTVLTIHKRFQYALDMQREIIETAPKAPVILDKNVTVTMLGDDGVWRPIEGAPAKMTVREMIERYGQQ